MQCVNFDTCANCITSTPFAGQGRAGRRAVERRADQARVGLSDPYVRWRATAEVYDTHSDDHVFVLIRVPTPGFFTLTDVLRVPEVADYPAASAPPGAAPRAAEGGTGNDGASAGIAGATEQPNTAAPPPPAAVPGPIVWKGACSRCGTASLHAPAYLCLHWYGSGFQPDIAWGVRPN